MIVKESHIKSLVNSRKECDKLILLDTPLIKLEKDREKLKLNIGILNHINTITIANRLYNNLKVATHIRVEIFFRVIKTISKESTLNYVDLVKYFSETRKVEQFYSTVEDFSQYETYVEYLAEFLIMGLKYDEYSCLSETEKEQLHMKYGVIHHNMRFNEITIEKHISQSKNLLKQYKKK